MASRLRYPLKNSVAVIHIDSLELFELVQLIERHQLLNNHSCHRFNVYEKCVRNNHSADNNNVIVIVRSRVIDIGQMHKYPLSGGHRTPPLWFPSDAPPSSL